MHTPEIGRGEILNDALVKVSQGVIEDICLQTEPRWRKAQTEADRLTEMGNNVCLLPGLVDTHIHAPQWPQPGRALHLPLQRWLHENTFPLEAHYSDPQFACRVYQDMVRTLLANATTTAVYFSSIHMRASQALAEICLHAGQRALVGKVCMDLPDQCPDYYRDASATHSPGETREFIQWLRQLADNDDERVRAVVTPRFIPSCSDELLEGLYFPDLDSQQDLFQKIVYGAQRSDIRRVWVHGNEIVQHG